MSNFISGMFMPSARRLAVSVLPQPVGPTHRKDPMGLFSCFNPACATSTVSTNLSITSSCPNTCVLMLVLRFSSDSVLVCTIDSNFTPDILDTCSCTSFVSTSLKASNIFALAHALSNTSMDLSGSCLSVIYFTE